MRSAAVSCVATRPAARGGGAVSSAVTRRDHTADCKRAQRGGGWAAARLVEGAVVPEAEELPEPLEHDRPPREILAHPAPHLRGLAGRVRDVNCEYI